MKTPIYDFVKEYSGGGVARFHMPGHKGRGALGCERYDITEIGGADVLYHADGIIAESEESASALFGTEHSFYSTEGSTLAIKAMLALALQNAHSGCKRRKILAARNVHSAFINACALLDLDVEWIGSAQEHICAVSVSADDVKQAIAGSDEPPLALYVTSPDYLGNVMDIEALARVCDEQGILLLVDNAHGAYLAFLDKSRHPIALGAHMCADSAHKTLPVLTGGAYLHVSRKCADLAKNARNALRLFASTSPSYLTLCSLDLANAELENGYADRIRATAKEVDELRSELGENGVLTVGNEPLKLTLDCHFFGYLGTRVAQILREKNIECEFADNRYAVLMISPENTSAELDLLRSVLLSIEKKTPIFADAPTVSAKGARACSIREAVLAPHETVKVENALGRICGAPAVSCPPAIPIAVSGEVIDQNTVELLRFYGIESIEVLK